MHYSNTSSVFHINPSNNSKDMATRMFHVNSTTHSRHNHFKSWPWKSKVKAMGKFKGQDHTGWASSSQFLFLSSQINQTNLIPEKQLYFKIWTWKYISSKVMVMSKVKVQGQTVRSRFYWLTSSHSWDTVISKSDLENPRSRSWMWSMFEIT